MFSYYSSFYFYFFQQSMAKGVKIYQFNDFSSFPFPLQNDSKHSVRGIDAAGIKPSSTQHNNASKGPITLNNIINLIQLIIASSPIYIAPANRIKRGAIPTYSETHGDKPRAEACGANDNSRTILYWVLNTLNSQWDDFVHLLQTHQSAWHVQPCPWAHITFYQYRRFLVPEKSKHVYEVPQHQLEALSVTISFIPDG